MTQQTNSKEKICLIDNSSIDCADLNIKTVFDYVANDKGRVDNMYKAMMHSPGVIKPIHDLYLALLHSDDSPLEDWLSELLSVQVAVLNQCSYALAHHSANLATLMNDQAKFERIMSALENRNWADSIADKKIVAMLDYGEKLCLHPDQIKQADIDLLRNQGLSEKEIVFIAQVNAGFAYWTRILNALGVELAGEPLGVAARSQS